MPKFPKENPVKADFKLYFDQSICILTALTPAALDWEKEHLPEDRQRFCGGTVIEPHCMDDIARGIRGDGLVIKGQA